MAIEMNGVNGHLMERKPDYDAIIVGAGFAGLRMIVELRKLNLHFKVLEEGSGVRGTWYWNRYPGAQTDSESWIYILTLSKELNDEWTWKERYPRQPEVLEYLNHVADRSDMRKEIQFGTRVKSATWDSLRNLCDISAAQGEHYTCKYFISATGVLSVGRELPFRGADKFRGETYLSYAWPDHAVDFKGKRVGIVGTGATGRTPNYVIPARNHPLTSEQQNAIKRNYEAVWQEARNELFGMGFEDTKLTTKDVKNDAAVHRVLEYGWELGGFRFIFQTFADLVTNEEANRIASEFVRNKIRAIVKDQDTAELLCPDHPLMAKRPPLGHHYFEAYNKPHVTLVDIRNNPIQEITETGIRLKQKDSRSDQAEYEFDIIIYALGFDVSTGPLTRLEVRGTEAIETLGQHWHKHLRTYLGLMVENYPNMFMTAGPQIPLGNFPIVLDTNAAWIAQCIRHMQKGGYKIVEARKEAIHQWGKLLSDVFGMTILAEAAKRAGSWVVGANIPGKPVAPLFWTGGVGNYFEICNAELRAGFQSLSFSSG